MKKLLIVLFVLVAARANATVYTSIVAFGDSLSDSGNAYNAGLNTSLVSPNYATGKYTDGSGTSPSTTINGVWVEQFASKFSLTIAASTSGGSNYSYGGATTGTASTGALGMSYQVSSYLSAHSSLSSSTIYTLWGGANDIMISIASGGNGLSAASTGITNITSQITSLANAGATTILWLNLPDLSLTPYGLSQSSTIQSYLHNSTVQYNTSLTSVVTSLEASHVGLNIVNVDVYTLFNAIVANPSSYGFTNVTTAAQGQSVDADTYLFWDTMHPTTYADSLIANLAYNDLMAIPEPDTIFLVVLGGMGLLLSCHLKRQLFFDMKI